MKTVFKTTVNFFWVFPLLLLITSCSDSPARIIKKNKSELNNILNNLKTIATMVSSQTLSSDEISLPANDPVMDMDDIGNYSYEGASNAQLFTAQDLLEPDGKSLGMHLFPSRMTWQTVKAMVKDGKFPESKEDSLQALKRLSGWRYAVVITTRSIQAPQIAAEPVSTNVTDDAVYSSGTFTPGMIEGDVLIYDLDDTAFLGGFPFTAQSSENVETTTYGSSAGQDGLQRQLDKDFTEQIKKAVLYGLIDRLPDDRVYMNGNLRQKVASEKGEESE